MVPDGSCLTYQPANAPRAFRRVGSSRPTEADADADSDLPDVAGS
jgi:hypothetical protein